MSKSLASILWALLEQGSSKIVALVVQIVLARLIAPEIFGTLAILLVFIDLANVISQSGLGSALIQEDNADAESFSTAVWISMGIALLVYGLLFFSAPAISAFYSMDLTACLRALSLVVFGNAYNSVQRAYFQKNMDFKALFIANVWAVILSGAMGITAAVLGCGLWALVLQVLCQSYVMVVALQIQLRWFPKPHFNITKARSLLSYGLRISGTGILNVFYTGISELILGKTCSQSDLGYYSQGRKWLNAGMGVIGTAVQNVLFPLFAKCKQDKELLIRSFDKAISVGTFVVAPLALLCAVCAEPLIAIILGEAWLPSVPIFQLTALSYIVMIPQTANLRAYMALGRASLYLHLQIIKVVLGIIVIGGSALLFENIYVVAGVVTLYCFVCAIVIDMKPAQQVIGMGRKAQLRTIAPIYGVSLLACVCSAPFNYIGLGFGLKLLIEIVVFGLVYIFFSKLFKLPALGECVSLIRTLLRKPVHK